MQNLDGGCVGCGRGVGSEARLVDEAYVDSPDVWQLQDGDKGLETYAAVVRVGGAAKLAERLKGEWDIRVMGFHETGEVVGAGAGVGVVVGVGVGVGGRTGIEGLEPGKEV